MTAQATLAPRPLFGGAISLELPTNYIDASDLRQIPDNQEVFLSSTSDTAIVLEVLGMVEDGLASTDLWEAVKFHFSSIAHDNASLESTILTPPPSSSSSSSFRSSPSPLAGAQTPQAVILSGTQRIHKFSHNPTGAPREGHEDDTPDEVWIGVALWRVWLEDTSASLKPSSTSTSSVNGFANGAGRTKKADVVLSVNVNLSAGDGQGEVERQKVESWFFDKAVQSFKIEDFNLFGDA